MRTLRRHFAAVWTPARWMGSRRRSLSNAWGGCAAARRYSRERTSRSAPCRCWGCSAKHPRAAPSSAPAPGPRSSGRRVTREIPARSIPSPWVRIRYTSGDPSASRSASNRRLLRDRTDWKDVDPERARTGALAAGARRHERRHWTRPCRRHVARARNGHRNGGRRAR